MGEANRMALREAFVAGCAGLRQHLTRRFGCADAVAEAVQDAWLRIGEATAIPALHDPDAYLARLAGNLTLDRRRAERRRRLLVEEVEAILDTAEKRPGPEEEALARNELRRLADALAEPEVRLGAELPGVVELPQVEVDAPRGTPCMATIGAPPPAYASGQVATGVRVGVLGNRNVFDTPFSVTGITEELSRNQQARTVADVRQNDSSVLYASSRAGGGDDFLLRGFLIGPSSIGFDGLFGIGDGRRPALEGIERVEILKGPSALLYGVPPFDGVGGAINLIPKRAPEQPLNRLMLGCLAPGEAGFHADVARRFGPDNVFGARVNIAVRDGKGPIEGNSVGLSVATFGLDYRGERLRLSGDAVYQDQDTDAQNGVISVLPGVRIPNAPNLRVSQNQLWEVSDQESLTTALRAEYDPVPNLTVYAAGGITRQTELSFVGSPTIINSAGDFSSSLFFGSAKFHNNVIEFGIRGGSSSGPVEHSVTVSASRLDNSILFGGESIGGTISSNIYDPVRVPRFDTTAASRNAPLVSERTFRGVSILETLSFLDGRVLLTSGGGYQQLETRSFDGSTGARTSTSSEDRLTPGLAVVVKALQNLSIYSNYVEAVEPGCIAPTTAVNAGESLPLFASTQIEVGAKYDFGDWAVTGALFQIVRPSAFTDPATNVLSAAGEQRHRGAEVSVFGRPPDGVRLLGGVTLLDAKLTGTPGGVNNGKTATGAPSAYVTLYGEDDLPTNPLSGLTLTGRFMHPASQFYNPGNTQAIRRWSRIDLGARYRFEVERKRLTARLNVAGTDYWERKPLPTTLSK